MPPTQRKLYRSLSYKETDKYYRSALKANIGHLEGAAGIAGVIKAILMLERGIIPPIAGLDEINGNIDHIFLKLEVCMT